MVFDSRNPGLVGADYSAWNDVLLILFMVVVLHPIRRLTEYAHAVRQGRKAVLPHLGAGEIGEMGRAFEKMRLALEDKAYVERYVQTLTHEIKSPISAISGAAELLEEDMPADQRSRFLANIRKESERIRMLVERLLALAAIEGLPVLQASQVVKPDELVAAVTDQIRPQTANRGIVLAVDLNGTETVAGDPFLLRQAIFNLLQNGVDSSPEKGRLAVGLCRQDTTVVLTVEDEGPGVPDFARRRVFEKFFSLRRPDTGEKSTGLGLNFVQEIAELHGGTVRLENRRVKGARPS